MRTNKIKLLSELLADIPKSESSIVNSAWLAMMGLRVNGDLISSFQKLWRSHFSKYRRTRALVFQGAENRIRVHPLFGGVYMRHCNVHDPDELIFEKSISVEASTLSSHNIISGIRSTDMECWFGSLNNTLVATN